MSDGISGFKTGSFPVLDESNFIDWLDLVETVLLSKGLWEYASGDATKPSEPDKAKEFEREDAKATAFLKMAAGREQRAHLLGLASSKKVLDKLKGVHQVSQQERVQNLLSKFHSFTAQDSIDLSASRLTQLQLEIAAADPAEKPSDTSKKTVLLQSLPEEYQSTVFALKAAGLSKASFDDVVQRLKEVETALKGRAGRSANNLARAARQRTVESAQDGRSPRKKDRRNVECYQCHKKGHYRSECWNLHGKPPTRNKEEPKRQSTEQSNTAAWSAQSQNTFVYQVGYGKPESQEWVLDSGCTRHMTFDRGHFIDYQKDDGTVTIADGKVLQIRGRGTIAVPIQGKKTQITGVLYVPKIGFNLLSISQLAERGMSCQFTGTTAVLSRNGETVATATRKGMTYVLGARRGEKAMLVSEGIGMASSKLWHRRLGHPGERKLGLIKHRLEGIPQEAHHLPACDVCRTTKSTHRQNKTPAPRASEPLARVYMDFWGPYRTPTIGGNRYMLTITDDFSRKSWIELAKERAEVYPAFRQWQAQAERETGRKMKAVRSDNAKEFLKLDKELEKAGVRIELTAAYTPSQNGVAERLNRTLITKARALLTEAELPADFWGEAVHTANYLKNRTPLEAGQDSPEQLWTGKRPSVGHFRVFGCVAFTHVPAAKREKLQPTATKGIFVGYTQTTRQFRVFDPKSKQVGVYSDVTFDESQKGGQLLQKQSGGQRSQLEPSPLLEIELEEANEHRGARPDRQILEGDEAERSDDDMLSNIDVHHPQGAWSETEEEPEAVRRPTRERRLPERYRDGAPYALRADYKPQMEILTPTSFEEATTGAQSRKWNLAIQDQLQSLEANHTWDIIDRPDGINPIDTKWVFKVKMLPNGQIDKYKARLCARGFTQQHGVDYFETFAPVIRMESLRILLALAAVKDLEVHQMDVVSAYLLGELEEDAFLKPPKGLEVPDGKVLKLKRGMPGLKQSGRVWNKTITAFFEKFGLYSIPADQSVFVNEDRSLIVALYVDDLVILAPTVEEMQPLKQALKDRFEMKDLGEAKYLLGIRITRDRKEHTLAIDQKHYIAELVGEGAIVRATTPVNGYANITRAEPSEAVVDVQKYQSQIGKLNWLTRATRPDIGFVTQRLSQFAHKPANRHQTGTQHVRGYLANTEDFRIEYSGGVQPAVVGYADADYAAEESRRSTMGYVFTFAGGPITWSSKLQRSVSTSTTEAEYHALAHAGKEAVWIRSILAQLGFEDYVRKPTPIYGDNQGAIALIKNSEFHARTKHIDVSAHYVRELVEDKKVTIDYTPTERMLADVLTKPLKKTKHLWNVKQLGLHPGERDSIR